MKKRKLKKSIKKGILYIFLIITIFIIIFCIFKIIMWAQDNKKTSEITKDINDNVTITNSDEEIIDIVNPDTLEEDPIWSYDSSLVKNVDLSKFYSINSDTVGWIIVQNTKINYPVVQTNNNDFYLNHSFDKKKNKWQTFKIYNS